MMIISLYSVFLRLKEGWSIYIHKSITTFSSKPHVNKYVSLAPQVVATVMYLADLGLADKFSSNKVVNYAT